MGDRKTRVKIRVEITIAGRNPSRAIRALAGRSDVEVVAFPESMSRLAARSRLAVLPLRCGGGTRLRIPYAFALGLPVVSTSLGCAGYDVTPGRQIMIADDAPSFARAVRQLIEDDQLADRLRRAARQLVEDRYRWDAVLASLENALLIAAGVWMALGPRVGPSAGVWAAALMLTAAWAAAFAGACRICKSSR